MVYRNFNVSSTLYHIKILESKNVDVDEVVLFELGVPVAQ